MSNTNSIDDFISVEAAGAANRYDVMVHHADGEGRVIATLPIGDATRLVDTVKAALVTWDGGFYLHECCAGGHAATRHIYPYPDEDPGTYMVCDDDGHYHGDIRGAAEIERLT